MIAWGDKISSYATKFNNGHTAVCMSSNMVIWVVLKVQPCEMIMEFSHLS
jgi:hypothetical protein